MKTTYLFLLLLITTLLCFPQQKKIQFNVEKGSNELSFFGANNTNDDLEITLTIKDIKGLTGYEKPITKLVKAKGKELFTRLSFKYNVFKYKIAYSYKKPLTETQKAIAAYKKDDYILKDLSKLNEGIVIFDDEGCGRCRLVTNYLVANKIDFKIIDLSAGEANQKLMWKTIKEKGASLKVKAPVIIVNGNLSHSHQDLKKFLESLH